MDLGRGLRIAIAKITGSAIVDEKTLKEMIRDLQRTLIANDVEVRLVFELSQRIEKRALDTSKLAGLSHKEHIVKVVYDELANMLGESYSPQLKKQKILLLGLYGSGKTTTAAKLANYFKKRGLSCALICADTERPAAHEQLQQLSAKIGAVFYGKKGEQNSTKIVTDALEIAKEDVLILDSAGRSAFDEELVAELKQLNDIFKPDEKFLVLSADIGQLAGRQARQFNEAIGLTGVIISRLDGSGKGGGALSAVSNSGSKVAFIGTGEKIDDLEEYNSKKFVGRLLGFPDIETLLVKVSKIAQEEKISREALTSDKFTIHLFYEQLKAAKKLGPLQSVFSLLGAVDLPKSIIEQSEEKLKKYESIINSMTKEERENAGLLKQKGRITRIARGSGVSESDIREFLHQFEQVEKLFTDFKKNRGIRRKIEKLLRGGHILKNLGT
ncbi:MAG: signal recognition particle receptor subunit alpha [Candidatus Anstonellales archaeon]